MADRKGQLALPVQLADHATFDNYYAADNAEAVEYLRRIADASHATPAWLWGPPAVGKSHLLQSVCASHPGRAAYLPGRDIFAAGAALIEGYERFAVVCIDDVDRLAGDRDWEDALFALCNALRDAGHQPLVASRANPRNVRITLPDLKSRLLAGPVFRLHELDDAARLTAVKMRASLRGLELPDDTGRYLLRRYRRDMQSLCRLLDELDTASLAAQRRLTIPFVKTILS